MAWKYRLTRLGWAKAILNGNNVFSFKGISRIVSEELRYYEKMRKANCLTASMLADSSFMEQLHYDETRARVEDSDWVTETWKEYAKRAAHGHGCCPNGTPKERKAYGTAFRKLVKDGNKRWEFASEEVASFDTLIDTVEAMTGDLESIAWTIQEHPVEEVYQAAQERWIDIGDVTVFCPECSEPMDGVNRDLPDNVEPHAFTHENCGCSYSDELGDRMSCLFNREGEPRSRFQCPNCGCKAALDALEGSFLHHFERPADWPPGAPYPPHRDFVGGPIDAFPDED